MEDIIYQENVKYVKNDAIERRVTAEFWPTDQVKVIKMKDGSFALGIDVNYYFDSPVHSTRTCRIFMDENGTPYIYIGEKYDFTEDNCAEEIKFVRYGNGESLQSVSGHPILTTDDGRPITSKSVFKFSKNSQEEEYVTQYFSEYYRNVSLNGVGLSLILEYIQDPANQQLLSDRLQPASKQELEMLQEEIKTSLDKFFKGEQKNYQVQGLIDIYDSVKKGLSLSGIIELDMPALDREYDKVNS